MKKGPKKLPGSPDGNIGRTFISIFYFPYQVKKTNQIKHIYRNPIYLAKEYKDMIDSGRVKSQAELAKLKGISRIRVTQILNLLKLDSFIIQELERLGDPLESKIITERILRTYISQPFKEQKDILNILN